MDEVSPGSSKSAENGGGSEGVKQAACLNCRRSKTRCLRDPGDVRCKRCAQTDLECIIPEYRVGRKKGVKNKRDGLDKAVHRIEQAIKKSRTGSSQSEDDFNAFRLQNLLSEAQGLLPRQSGVGGSSDLLSQPRTVPREAIRHSLPTTDVRITDENYSVDDAENPLQLLARASNLSVPPQQPQSFNGSFNVVPVPNQIPSQNLSRDQELLSFFGPFRPKLDIEDESDPVFMGLVTVEEAEMLFAFFYQNLAHTRWGLDPLLHTPDFVRKRSSFLFTSILVASSLFLPSTAALSKRLSVHCKNLARGVIANQNHSPEVALAFMVNIPWMPAGNHWSDDETPVYMAMALTIATDLSLNKLIVPSPTHGGGVPPGIAPSECITARKALDLDGFQDVDLDSAFGRRLLRSRERIWLALFVLDRGVCLARGRSFTVPLTPLIESCDEWHKSEIADVWDGSIISSAILRRDLVDLISQVKRKCDLDHEITANQLQDMIEGFFNRWYATWTFAIGGNNGNSIPPYVEILVTHGRLSIYSSVINHPTAPYEVKRFFRAAGLSSGLNVMRAAVQGESRLKSMPNNTVIMISFAAMISVRLSTIDAAPNSSLAPSIRVLIEETADVLERIGTNPAHRNGASTLYGRHLRHVVSLVPQGRIQQPDISNPSLIPTQAHIPSQQYQNPARQSTMQMSELLQFSAMSDDQIVQAINDAGDELGNYVPSFQIDERSGLDWLDWFNMEVNT